MENVWKDNVTCEFFSFNMDQMFNFQELHFVPFATFNVYLRVPGKGVSSFCAAFNNLFGWIGYNPF